MKINEVECDGCKVRISASHKFPGGWIALRWDDLAHESEWHFCRKCQTEETKIKSLVDAVIKQNNLGWRRD